MRSDLEFYSVVRYIGSLERINGILDVEPHRGMMREKWRNLNGKSGVFKHQAPSGKNSKPNGTIIRDFS